MQRPGTILPGMAEQRFQFDPAVFRCARESRRISQGNLAVKLGVSRTFLSMIERGERRPSLELIGRIEEVTQSTAEEWGVTGLPPRLDRPAA
jgi:transcriptional regulator with XRE-family HTH domain